MTDDEAIDICGRWLVHLDRQREHSEEMGRLAQLARCGPLWHHVAKRAVKRIDSQPRVYDGGRLEPAVRHLVYRVESAPL